MDIYKVVIAYRGVNKTKKGEKSQYPPFFVFKKEDLVAAEIYNPSDVSGLTFPQTMLIVSGTYIVPAKNLEKLEGQELKDAMVTLGISEPEQERMAAASGDTGITDVTDLTNAPAEINVSKLPEDDAKIVEGLNKSTVTNYGKIYGTGGLIGGIAGFGVAYFMKKNKWVYTCIGVAAGIGVSILWNQNKKSSNKVDSTSGTTTK